MNKTIFAERIYSLGNYQNIKLSNTIIDIPEEIAMNEKAMSLLQYLLLLDVESSYQKYIELYEKLQKFTSKQEITALDFIEKERISTFEQLLITLYPPIFDEEETDTIGDR